MKHIKQKFKELLKPKCDELGVEVYTEDDFVIGNLESLGINGYGLYANKVYLTDKDIIAE